MKKTIAVIGLGRFGLSIVKTLSTLNCDVIAVDINVDCVTKAADYIEHCVVCDATKKASLKEIGVANVDHAIVAIGNDLQATILSTINLKELGVNHITVRIDDEEFASLMERLGATDVIIPEEASAAGLANQIMSDSLLDYYNIDQEYGVAQIKIPSDFVETTLIDMDIRNKFDVNIVGIIRNDKFFIPKGTDSVKQDDVLMICGKRNKILKVDRQFWS